MFNLTGPECDVKQANYTPPTILSRLEGQKRELEDRLNKTNAALEVFKKYPEIKEVLEVLSQGLR
jgi:hypothetical protein